MRKVFIIILFLLFCQVACADLLDFVTEDGQSISEEYIVYCRDARGRFVKCPKEGDDNFGYIVGKPERRCRNADNGRFIRCPDETDG